MGKYISQSNIENVFGEDNVALWSNLEGGTTADTIRIALAITYAEGILEDTFRNGRYALPFTPVVVIIVDWCAKLAGIWLFFCRPGYGKDSTKAEGFSDLRQSVWNEVASYQAGQKLLDCTFSESKNISGPVIT